ncbi:hypothetical protein LTR08_007818 [Meristemomyces frigidus]|nr:hypothetical protein LTR08_007818 [Meristemomyces frigidus]
MAQPNSFQNRPILNLTQYEKRAFAYLWNQAGSDSSGRLYGEPAAQFFQRTGVSLAVLGGIWEIVDSGDDGFLIQSGFCMVLRLIGHCQAGEKLSPALAFKPAPVPKFDGLQIPGAGPTPQQAVPSPTHGRVPANALQPQLSGQGLIRVPPLDQQTAQQYSGLFERSGAQDGKLEGPMAKNIFDRAGLPGPILQKIWNLSDQKQRGWLDETEFIIAMHLVMSMKTRTMTALPNTLPPGLYEAAARRGVPPPSRQDTGSQAIPRQFTGGSAGAPARTQSPLAASRSYATPPTQSAQTTGTPWLIAPQEKAIFDQLFATVDTNGQGAITGDQALTYFRQSGLPDSTLASIWDLASINRKAELSKDEFAVAMYFVQQQCSPNPPSLPTVLPSAMIPPSMRQPQQPAQRAMPDYGNPANKSNLPKSAAEDLFGLDEPSPPQPQQPALAAFQPQLTGLQAQNTGTSAARDPFDGSIPGSPSNPQPFPPPAQQASSSTMFKPFMPTSAFGATLSQQHTGGSMTSSQGQPRGFPQQQQAPSSHLQQASVMDDLLGDNDTHAEEASKLTSETTELANMSNQIGNLRSQMEQTQGKKATTQADLTATSNQKRELELRLQQFRSQYETEVRAVKELETQLTASRESTKKLGQDLAMIEASHQDLQTQHNSVGQALQADQQENAGLKQKIAQLNAEVSQLKPAVEKMKLEARQQKGLVSINKKQVATNEGEMDRLHGEKGDLERQAAEREEQARTAAQQQQNQFGRDAAIGAGVGAAAFGGYEATRDRSVASPDAGSRLASPSGVNSMNPFFRKPSAEAPAERATSQSAASGTGPTPSAFDALFGPSSTFSPSGPASRTGTPPATSFGRNVPAPSEGTSTTQQPPHAPGMTDSVRSVSSAGDPTPSATPPLSVDTGTKDSPQTAEPPPLPENKQFTPGQLPLGGLRDRSINDDADSTAALPPASRAGGTETPRDMPEPAAPGAFDAPPEPTPGHEDVQDVPGAFASEEEQPRTSAQEMPADEPLEQQQSHTVRDAMIGAGAGVAAGAAALGSYLGFKGHQSEPTASAAQPTDDFDSAFDGFGEGEQAKESTKDDDDPFATSSGQQQSGGRAGEFPPIRSMEPEDDESSDEESERGGFSDHFGARSPPRDQAAPERGAAEPVPVASALPNYLAPDTYAREPNTAGARPTVKSVASTASSLPGIASMPSPPTYEQSDEPSHGGHGERSASNSFPPEFGDLLPARGDPTSPPLPAHESSEQAVVLGNENERPTTGNNAIGTASFQTPPTATHADPTQSYIEQGMFPSAQTPSSSDTFHDTYSRPVSNVTDMSPERAPASQPSSAVQSKNSFDDFDDFGDLSEAKEADRAASELDFGFGRQSADDFSSAFDSPAESMTTTMVSSQQTPVPSNRQLESNGFANYQHNASSSNPFGESSGAEGASSIQHTPQNMGHDWDSIFSGLDNSKGVDTSLNTAGHNDPWGAPANDTAFASADRTPVATSPVSERTTKAFPIAPVPTGPLYGPPQPPAGPPTGRALTPGTEHDDPFLKRLTGMGFPRAEALSALEKYDYDVNRAIDHLSS